MSERFSAPSLRLISAAFLENNELVSSYQMTFSLDHLHGGHTRLVLITQPRLDLSLAEKAHEKKLGQE